MQIKTYDRAYFDRWYRDPRHAVNPRALLERKVSLAVAMAEYYLARKIVNVLDVGCGEGVWRAPLKKLRSDVDYLGLDSSNYAIERFGKSRNLRLASFAQLETLRFERRFDLIVCSDVIHYLAPKELRAGLSGISAMLDGVAFLELFTARDAPEGDKRGFIARSAKWYLSTFSHAGLTACGTHCYIGPQLDGCVAALETIQAA